MLSPSMLYRACKLVVPVLLGALMCGAQAAPAKPSARHSKSVKAAKQPPPPPQPVAIPQMSPEQLPPQPPRVTFQNGQLTVDSQNSTLGDVLAAIRRQTGAQLDLPAGIGSERVAAHLAGPPRDVITSLLDGSNLGYIILGTPDNPENVQKLILTVLPRGPAGQTAATASNRPAPEPQPFQPPATDFSPDEDQPDVVTDRNPLPPDQSAPPPQAMPPGTVQPQGFPGQPNPNPEGSANPYVPGEQPRGGQPAQIAPGQQPNPDQPQIKTPDQLLQELQRMRNRQQNPQQNPQQQPPQ